MSNHTNFFSIPPSKIYTFNRSSHLRQDASFIQNQMKNEKSLFLPFHQLNALAVHKENTFRASWLKYNQVENFIPKSQIVFLGVFEDSPRFAIDVSDANKELFETENKKFYEFRNMILHYPLDWDESYIIGQARSLIHWNMMNKFCSACGHETISCESGYKRSCTNKSCITQKGTHNIAHPRSDPVVIMAIISLDKQKILLGRRKGRYGNMYSCLAGFTEPGESIEDAVRREAFEEAGVIIGDVKYHSSQPWPFPANLMIGCFGYVIDEKITIDNKELDDARWFTKEECKEGLERSKLPFSEERKEFFFPGDYAIAHWLIKEFAEN